MLTNAGGGFSAWHGLDVTPLARGPHPRRLGPVLLRPRPAQRRCLVRGVISRVGRPADEYEVVYSADKAEFRRRDGGIETHLEVTVSPENARRGAPAHARPTTTPGRTSWKLTSYAEVVLAPHAADLAHPAFGKLFLETECAAGGAGPAVPAPAALRRAEAGLGRPRRSPWTAPPSATCSTRRTGPASWAAAGRRPIPPPWTPGAALSGTTGAVLDPIFSLRRRVRVAPGTSVSVAFTTAVGRHARGGAGPGRPVPRRPRRHARLRAGLGAQPGRAAPPAPVGRGGPPVPAAGRARPLRRAGPAGRPAVLAANRQGQRGPVAARHLRRPAHRAGARGRGRKSWRLVRQLLLRPRLLAAQGAGGRPGHPQRTCRPATSRNCTSSCRTLVRASDSHDLHRQAGRRLRAQGGPPGRGGPGPAAGRGPRRAVRRPRLAGRPGGAAGRSGRSLPGRLRRYATAGGPGRRSREPSGTSCPASALRPPARPASRRTAGGTCCFDNGLGGFTPAAASTSSPSPRALPPAPWINVIANPHFGFLVSESGGGYTWAGNSQTNRLTPWSNDPVSDPPGEVVYLRDEATGEVWTPTPLPLAGRRLPGPPRRRATRSSSRQPRAATGTAAVRAADDPVKLVRLRVRNTGRQPRPLSATFYAEWVLGTVRDQAPMHVVTEVDAETGALLARNASTPTSPAGVAFADVNLAAAHLHGRPHRVPRPQRRPGRARRPWSATACPARSGPGLDPAPPCMAQLDAAPGRRTGGRFPARPGGERGGGAASGPRVPRPGGRASGAFDEVPARWDGVLGAVQVRTPDAGTGPAAQSLAAVPGC